MLQGTRKNLLETESDDFFGSSSTDGNSFFPPITYNNGPGRGETNSALGSVIGVPCDEENNPLILAKQIGYHDRTSIEPMNNTNDTPKDSKQEDTNIEDFTIPPEFFQGFCDNYAHVPSSNDTDDREIPPLPTDAEIQSLKNCILKYTMSQDEGVNNLDDTNMEWSTNTRKRRKKFGSEPPCKIRKLSDSELSNESTQDTNQLILDPIDLFAGNNNWSFVMPGETIDHTKQYKFVKIGKMTLVNGPNIPLQRKIKIEVISDNDDRNFNAMIRLLKYCKKPMRKDAKNSLLFGPGEETKFFLVPCKTASKTNPNVENLTNVKHYLKILILDETDTILEEFTSVCLFRRGHNHTNRSAEIIARSSSSLTDMRN